ncbi:MAG: DUF6273 domain-containing protein [Oscillospiraceae bacterium]|nr:DUF6273 domain-containing protein [Oscillospiraceae bacterium]
MLLTEELIAELYYHRGESEPRNEKAPNWRAFIIAGLSTFEYYDHYAIDSNFVHKKVTWNECYLNKYLNSQFIENYDIKEILTVNSPKDKNLSKIFLLSGEEVQKYLPNSEDWIFHNNYGHGIKTVKSWWLRPNDKNGTDAVHVYANKIVTRPITILFNADGKFYGQYYYSSNDMYVRPAMWIKL